MKIPKICSYINHFCSCFQLNIRFITVNSDWPSINTFDMDPFLLITKGSQRIMGTNLVLGPPKKFYRRNPSGTLRDVHWYHLGDPKKVPGASSQGFLNFLGFDKNKLALLWGEAQKKIAYSYLKVT